MANLHHVTQRFCCLRSQKLRKARFVASQNVGCVRGAGLAESSAARDVRQDAQSEECATNEFVRRPAGSFRFENSRIRGSGCASPADFDAGIAVLVGEAVRDMAVSEGLRPDGRGLTDLRPVHCEVRNAAKCHNVASSSFC